MLEIRDEDHQTSIINRALCDFVTTKDRLGPNYLFEIVLEPVHVFLALDLERAVVAVEFERDAHGGVHLEVVARVAVVVLRVGRLQRAHPPGGQVAASARHHLAGEKGNESDAIW